ncbi:MAG: HlyD family efflux transporter periplasmic adaptor subunit [Caulobacteraceae bacterium]
MAFRLRELAAWRSRPVALIGGALVVVALVVGFGLAHHPAAAGGAEQSVVVQPRPFASTLSLQGAITPGDVVSIVAPFDGKVAAVGFEYGAPVSLGQALVALDTSDVEQRRDEAQSEFLKASQAADDMASWASGPEMSQARRAEASAAFDLADTRRKAVETKALLDRGLVARDEYDGLLQQQRGQEGALAAARQEVAEAQKRGSGASRRVAQIDLAAARARLAQADAQRAGATVRAPVAGVIVHPAGDKPDTAGPSLHPGLPLTKGQLIAAIARPGGLGVAFQLSEADANRVRPGQRVSVTGPGFEGMSLQGTVTSVAREATPSPAGAGAAVSFAAGARLNDLTGAQAVVIRIGMTANVTVDLYRNPAALVVPPAAVQGEAPDTWLTVKRGGGTRRAPVRIGQVAPDGVEILSGLKAGDTVVWSISPTASADAGGPSS